MLDLYLSLSLSSSINPNPIALGPRWLAYAEHKLLHSKRSGGGCDGEGVPSYTATVLNAAKSFGKGLRELGEQVAAGLTGTSAGSGNSSKSSSFDSASGGVDGKQSGVVTIIDVKVKSERRQKRFHRSSDHLLFAPCSIPSRTIARRRARRSAR